MNAHKNTPDVVGRFFLALKTLKRDKVLRAVSSFAADNDINRRNLWFIENNPNSGMFEVGWLTALVVDYNVNPAWLLTGEGDFYQSRKKPLKSKNVQKTCNSEITDIAI